MSMSSNFFRALSKIRQRSSNTVEQGNAFEKLSKIYFENDDIQKQQYNKVWHYREWAKKNPGFSKVDIGIDLVGELRDGSGFAAIQCKFFNFDHQISKSDLDTFISASANDIFTRLVLIDTSNADLGLNAKSMIDNLNKTYLRIQKYDLENSRIDWLEYLENEKISLLAKKEPRDHQILAIKEAYKFYSKNNRGKMIMACGTGKTYTSLKIAEKIASKKLILYMVPSLALMSQTIREWKNDSIEEFTAFSACSDKKIGRKKNDSDKIEIKLNELAFPATTDSKILASEISKADKDKMIVIFSTYQSIEVITDAQKKYGLKPFDLIICDEAHRTTGATFENEEDSYFVRIHNNKYVEAKKRLYMTATPRIFGNKAKQKAYGERIELSSMDDTEIFGEEFFNRGFNWAVENNLLSDYKVVILAVDENLVNVSLQKVLKEGSELQLNDATKIIGVYKALAKVGFEKNSSNKIKFKPIKKALAFAQNISISKIFEKEFQNVINDYSLNEKISQKNKVDLNVEVNHVDGTFNADSRNERLNWLKEDTNDNTCRILSNVKCMSEGVDVPSLDAIIFLHPKKSQIDVVQAVGRVMRKAPGKKLGYVIIPITVAPGVSPEVALNNNEKYKVVWQIVNALRTHDERLDNKINMLSLGEDVSDKIDIMSISEESEATIAKVDNINKKNQIEGSDITDEIIKVDDENNEDSENIKKQLNLEIENWSQVIKAKIVEKCGTRDYWENWASDIAVIANKHISEITKIVIDSKNSKRKIFLKFLDEIRDDLNPSISESDAIEMLAQHIITKPVFDALFKGYEFSKENSISKAINSILDKIYKLNDDSLNDQTLVKFYESVKRRSEDIVTSQGRSALINELYERFFSKAFPLTASKLGIVYTPIEIVDFINHSTNEILKDEFNVKLEDKNVHILDPFTGTGTFIARLLQTEIISKKNIAYKYKNELHANEIVLLAYYIAGINIESTYQDIMKPNSYEKFEGAVLTDTFHLYEQDRDMLANLLPDNSNKRTKQKKSKIRVIIGNPPYSVGQSSLNDDAANIKYPNLEQKIRETYAKASKATNVNSLYDSYVKAFRWASDRLDDNGLIGFVTNAGWVDANAMDGLRKCFSDEFDKIYVFHLRGNQRTSGETSRKEGGKIFGSGSRAPIAITFLIKKDNKKNKQSKIYFYDIGDYLNRDDKLKIIKKYGHINNLKKLNKFTLIKPDENNDWINKGNQDFNKYILIGSKKNTEKTIFKNYTGGLKSNRDPWNTNFSKEKLSKNVSNSIKFFNKEVERFQSANNLSEKIEVKKFISKDKSKISWDEITVNAIQKGKKIKFYPNAIDIKLYRPFNATYTYTDREFNNRMSLLDNSFLNKKKNIGIFVSGIGSNAFSCLMVDRTPDIQFLFNGQCFPLFWYENRNTGENTLFEADTEEKSYNINNETVEDLKKKYNTKNITCENIFYYIYAVLHHPEYKILFSNNLSKGLPRIPYVHSYESFIKLSKAGENLSGIHINYEKAQPYPVNIKKNNLSLKNKTNEETLYHLKKMRFVNKTDKSSVRYNTSIIIENIPIEAYQYQIGGRSALEWIMDRQSIKVDKDSEIINDPNDFANNTMKNPSYPLNLFKKIITVSLETLKIIRSFPTLNLK